MYHDGQGSDDFLYIVMMIHIWNTHTYVHSYVCCIYHNMVLLNSNFASTWSLLASYLSIYHLHLLFVKNITVHLKYDGYFCKGMLFQLKPCFIKLYIVLITYYHVQLCFTKQEPALCFPLSKSSRVKQEILIDWKYLVPLRSYGIFLNFVYSARPTK